MHGFYAYVWSKFWTRSNTEHNRTGNVQLVYNNFTIMGALNLNFIMVIIIFVSSSLMLGYDLNNLE